ncbi:penicillin acylase family protein [Streptomyces sp. NBC_00201]|uniref:penicillin acylase family protein n=1 Tax=unclassified Streptomyces TaxID=2593676 RepID=UPI00224E8F36|nr:MULTISPECIES: penicillin acylase family protein [unclassified Streptomyces]MCX5056462.1 penicillin acylase family protein [Streptomyces sp. NBC_00452]MCX5246617.1 penicillin acylase family protein [Streptomyces sp. NBC_00201]
MPPNTTATTGDKPGKSGRKKGRKARLVVLVLVLAIIGGIAYGAYWSISTVRASFPQTKGSITLDGLSGPVDVKRDGNGIPQIYASSDADLFMAQGYVQAQDRFYEMDVRRHMTSGRLSEMFGKGQVKNDEFLRTLGWDRVAKKEYDTKLSASTKKYLQAYAKGVNAYLQGKDGTDISLEYAALGFTNDYKPSQWTPVDSVSWLKAMAWDLRGNMQDEIDRALMTSRLGPKQIADLYPDYPYSRNKAIVQEGQYNALTKTFEQNGGTSGSGTSTGGTAGTSSTSTGSALQSQLSGLYNVLDDVPTAVGVNGQGIGSNSWVVAGSHTITGHPLLANDPHLSASLPSVWYQMGLHCRTVSSKCQYDVTGYTFAGMPGVVIGHNQDIAWGMTNSGVDVTDLYLEKLSGDGYLYDGTVKPLTTREETIKVAGGAAKKIIVRQTADGMPLLSDRDDELVKVGRKAAVDTAAPDRGDGYGIALRWTALAPGTSMDAVFAMDKASNWSQFRSASKLFDVPSQNLVYADKDNIGYTLPGKIPTRAKKDDGSIPAPGWDSGYKWTGYIPQDALPYEYNPKRGYIVTANQAVVDPDKYPYTLTTDWGYGTRSQRITDLIESKIKGGGKVSTDDMRQMQLDNSSEIAKLLVPKLLKIDLKDKDVRQAQELLEGWDYTQDADSAAAAYFNAVWRNVLKLAFGNKLPKELRVEGQCLWVDPVSTTGPADDTKKVRECGQRDADQAQPDGGDRWFEVVRTLMNDKKSDWWTTPKSLTRPGADDNRDDLFARAMIDARWELTAKLGKDIDTWSWGRLHRLFLKNQTLGTDGPGFLKYILNRGPWKLSGGEATVNATGWNAAGGYGVVWVPSMRMVVNLGDLDKSKWINLTGASGHAYSAHYTDQTSKWVKGELLDWNFTDKAVDKDTSDTLVLKP